MSLISNAKKLISQVPKIQQAASISTTAIWSSCDDGKCPSIRIVGCGPRVGYDCKKTKKRSRCVKVDAPTPSFSECLRCPPPPRRVTECPNCCHSAYSPRPNPPKHCVEPNYGTSIDGCNPKDSMRMLGSCRPRNMGSKKVNKPCEYVDPTIVVCDPCVKPYRNECSPPCKPVPTKIKAPPCFAPNSSCREASKPATNETRPICEKPKPTCDLVRDCQEPVVFHYKKPTRTQSNPTSDKPMLVSSESKPACKQSLCSLPEMKSSVFVKLKPRPNCGLAALGDSQATTTCDEPQQSAKPVAIKPTCSAIVPRPARDEPQPKVECIEPKPVCETAKPACETEPTSESKLKISPPKQDCREAKQTSEKAFGAPDERSNQTKDKPICCSRAVCDPRTTPLEMEAALETCRPCDEKQKLGSEIVYSKPATCSEPLRVSAKKSILSLIDLLLDMVNLQRKQ